VTAIQPAQPCLFSTGEHRRPSNPRQREIEAASDHEGRAWQEKARAWLLAFGATRRAFTGEEAVAASNGNIEAPEDKRAWGGVFQAAARSGLIRRIGYAPRDLNGSPQPVWEVV
jgi:hypothetical protein